MRAIILMIMTAMLFALGTSAGNAQVDSQAAQALAERIADTGSGDAVVIVGGLPGGWTSPVALPQGLSILGSVTNRTANTVTIYYQVPDVRAEYDKYVATLRTAGFEPYPQSFEGVGFVAAASTEVPRYASFCHANAAVSISTTARAGDLRVSVTQNTQTPSMACMPVSAIMDRLVNPLPHFASPPGTTMAPLPVVNGSSVHAFSDLGAPSVTVSAAAITGKVTAQFILQSLESQLRDAKWAIGKQGGGADGGFATLQYGSGAKSWSGMLVVYASTTPNTYIARVDATGGPISAQETASQPSHLPRVPETLRKSDEPAVLQLMKRLFSEYAGFPEQVYFRRVPLRLNKAIPLPDQRPLGSTEVTLPPDPTIANPPFTLYYTLNGRHLQSYYARLKSKGWNVMSFISPEANLMGGFQPAGAGQIAAFCKPGLPYVMIQALDRNAVNISIGRDPCATLQRQMTAVNAAVRAQLSQQFVPLPVISAPAGMTIRPGQPGSPGLTSAAEIQSAQPLALVADALGSQIEKAGWKLRAAALNDAVVTKSDVAPIMRPALTVSRVCLDFA